MIFFADLSNIIRLAVDNLNRTGVVVVNVVSDNATSNVSMFGHLGAKLTDPEPTPTPPDQEDSAVLYYSSFETLYAGDEN